MKNRYGVRLRVEELERRDTPSSAASALALPDAAPPTDAIVGHVPAAIPNATGSYFVTVMASNLSGPVVVPLTISDQTGAHFTAAFIFGDITVVLKGQVHNGAGTVNGRGDVMMGGQNVGDASFRGTFGETPPPIGDQPAPDMVASIDVSFSAMSDGVMVTGTASLVMSSTTT
jgi:hypothetical protein